MLGPKRFGLIRAGLPGIATNMLARRLEEMEAAGILVHRTLPLPARVPVYELTDHGRALRVLLLELCRWGVALPGHDPRLPISPTSLMLSMEAMMRPGPGGFTAGFDLGAESFVVTVEGPRFEARPGEATLAGMRFSAPPNDMASAIYGPAPLAQVIESGRISFSGDMARGQAFVDLFRLARP